MGGIQILCSAVFHLYLSCLQFVLLVLLGNLLYLLHVFRTLTFPATAVLLFGARPVLTIRWHAS